MGITTKKRHRDPLAYGGTLLQTRAGRSGPRPISVSRTMHLVLRSSQAKGKQSFLRPEHSARIQKILGKFSEKYKVKVVSRANVGNHLHFHVKLNQASGYKPFIRAVTAAIAMAVAGTSRWNPAKRKFWDKRPFTRIVTNFAGWHRLESYIMVNCYEAMGYSRAEARWAVTEELALARYG